MITRCQECHATIKIQAPPCVEVDWGPIEYTELEVTCPYCHNPQTFFLPITKIRREQS